MSSVTSQLASTPVERWVRKVEFVSLANLEDLGKSIGSSDLYNLNELHELVDRTELAKRSKPSYQWQTDEQGRWWRVWFQESNLTIQIDLHLSDGRYQMNMYEIDLEQCNSATKFVEYLYEATLHKQWACPEMLWAIMEVTEEASKKRFGKEIRYAYSMQETLNWAEPNS